MLFATMVLAVATNVSAISQGLTPISQCSHTCNTYCALIIFAVYNRETDSD